MTGSSGFIGQHLVERLSKKYQLDYLTCDLLDFEQVNSQVLNSNPDIIIHLAARTEVEKSFTEQITFSQINYVGTVNLIESARKLPNLKNFIFASTMEVYGWQPISDLIRDEKPFTLDVFDEQRQPNPNAPYAVAKYGCEKYLEYASRSYGMPYTIFRQTNSYGRTDNDFFVVEQIITQMLKNKDEIHLGYDKPYRNFLYITDLLDAYEAVLSNTDKVKNNIFCLGPNNALSISDLANLIASKLNWNGKILWGQKPKRPGEIYCLNSTNNKLTNLTGWAPKISLDIGLGMTIDYWKNNI